MNGVLITKEKISRETLKDKTIDIHTHAAGINFTNYFLEAFPYCNNVCDLVTNMQKNGVDYSVTFPVPTNINTFTSPNIDKDIRKVIEAYEKHPYYFENKRLLEESIIFGNNQILPFIMISLHSKIDEQIETYYELKEKYNIYGFKINPSTDRKNISTILHSEKLKSFFEKEKLPILIHSANDDFSSGTSCLSVVEELKNIRFCIAHVARMNEGFLDKVNDLKNTWFDLSPLIKLYEMISIQNSKFLKKHNINTITEFIIYLCNTYPDKVIYGSDYPWSYCGYLKSNLDKQLSDIYEENVKLLKMVPNSVSKKISSQNSINYLFGNKKNE